MRAEEFFMVKIQVPKVRFPSLESFLDKLSKMEISYLLSATCVKMELCTSSLQTFMLEKANTITVRLYIKLGILVPEILSELHKQFPGFISGKEIPTYVERLILENEEEQIRIPTLKNFAKAFEISHVQCLQRGNVAFYNPTQTHFLESSDIFSFEFYLNDVIEKDGLEHFCKLLDHFLEWYNIPLE